MPPYKDAKTLEQAEGWAKSYPNKASVVGVFEKMDDPNLELFTDLGWFL